MHVRDCAPVIIINSGCQTFPLMDSTDNAENSVHENTQTRVVARILNLLLYVSLMR